MIARTGLCWRLRAMMLAAATVTAPTYAFAKLLAYVPMGYDNSFYVIDTDSNAIIATVPLTDCEGPTSNQSCFPGSVAMLADGSRGYVNLSYPAGLPGGAVAVFDARTRTFTKRIPVGENPNSIALTPDERRAYVGNRNDATISVIDLQAESVVATIPVGGPPLSAPKPRLLAAAMSPDGKRLYVANESPGVAVIDTEHNALVGTIDVGADPLYGRYPWELAVTPDSRFVYIANSGDGTISVVDTGSDVPIALLTPPHRYSLPSSIAISPGGSRAYVVTSQPQHLQEIDTKTNTMRDTGLALPYFGSVAITPDGARGYFVNAVYKYIAVVDLSDYQVLTRISVGDGPWGIAFAPAPDSAATPLPSASATPDGSLANVTVTVRLVPGTPTRHVIPVSPSPPTVSPSVPASMAGGTPSGASSGCSVGAESPQGDWSLTVLTISLGLLGRRWRRARPSGRGRSRGGPSAADSWQ